MSKMVGVLRRGKRSSGGRSSTSAAVSQFVDDQVEVETPKIQMPKKTKKKKAKKQKMEVYASSSADSSSSSQSSSDDTDDEGESAGTVSTPIVKRVNSKLAGNASATTAADRFKTFIRNSYNSKFTSAAANNKKTGEFPPTKPGRSWMEAGKYSFRTGYMGGQIVLRISARSEFGNRYDGGVVVAQSKKKKRDGSDVGNDTVFLLPSEYLILREKFDDMVKKCDVKDGMFFYHLIPDNEVTPGMRKHGDPTNNAQVTIDSSGVRIMSTFAGTFGKVSFTKAEFKSLEKAINYFWWVFKFYDQSPIAGRVMDAIFTQAAGMMVKSIRQTYSGSEIPAFGDEKYLKAFFHAYSLVTNFAYSTEIIKHVIEKFDENEINKIDLYSMFYTGMNMLDVLSEYISADTQNE
jgi:hypothetical protein